MRPLAPALQESTGRSKAWSGSALLNCFSEHGDGDKRADFAVMAIPGLTSWLDFDGPGMRGAIVMGGLIYAVAGASLYSVDSEATATALGVIAGSGPVRMATNGTELGIAADGKGYVLSDGSLSTPLSYDVSDVAFLDGYLIWTVKDSDQFFISALDDALTYDGLDIATVEGSPDDLKGVVVNHREVMFPGDATFEVWYDSGALAFPIERQGNAFVERGCFDRDSLVKIDNSVMFCGDDRIIYTFNGYTPQRLSTHAIEYHLRNATYCRAWTYAEEGHKFYIFECDNGTFALDLATGAWHQRQSWGSDFYRGVGAIDAFGMTLIMGRDEGKLYTVSLDVFEEDGDPIPVQIELPTIENARDYATMYAFEVTIQPGVGNASVTDPQIMLQYSDDGGNIWSNELWRSMGKVGEYRNRAVWRTLGRFRTRQMKLRMTDAARRFVIGYWADTR